MYAVQGELHEQRDDQVPRLPAQNTDQRRDGEQDRAPPREQQHRGEYKIVN